jgi:hypothetical protein
MENGKWKMENGKWRMENGEWKMENEPWITDNRNSLSGTQYEILRSKTFEIFIDHIDHIGRFFKNLNKGNLIMKPAITRLYALLVALILATLTTAVCADTLSKGDIKFKKGETSATLEDGLARGELNEYTLKAMGGQTMSVTIDSVESNAVFELHLQDKEGKRTPLQDAKGNAVAEATDWSGTLPGKGLQTYIVVVGAIRGGAIYIMKVTITD